MLSSSSTSSSVRALLLRWICAGANARPCCSRSTTPCGDSDALKRCPWIRSQWLATSSASWPWVSTPSASTPHLQAVGHVDDRAGDGHVLGGGGDIVHEGPIDLDHIDRQVAQMRQAGVAGAEVVQRDLHPQGLDPAQGLCDGRDIAHQHALGHFDTQALRRQVRGQQGRLDLAHDVGVAKLVGREVHGHAHGRQSRLKPAHGLRASRVQDPGAQVHDEPGALGQGHGTAGAQRHRNPDVPSAARLRPRPPHRATGRPGAGTPAGVRPRRLAAGWPGAAPSRARGDCGGERPHPGRGSATGRGRRSRLHADPTTPPAAVSGCPAAQATRPSPGSRTESTGCLRRSAAPPADR